MLMQVEISRDKFIYYGAIAGATVGLLLGLVILILGLKKGKRNLGIGGLVCTIVCGAVSGLLAIISAGIFAWLILKKPEMETTNAAAPDADASDSIASDSER